MMNTGGLIICFLGQCVYVGYTYQWLVESLKVIGPIEEESTVSSTCIKVYIIIIGTYLTFIILGVTNLIRFIIIVFRGGEKEFFEPTIPIPTPVINKENNNKKYN